MKKRLAALFCALLLLLALALPASGSSSPTIYLLAINDKLCDLPGGALPVSAAGTIYVPYTVFDKSSSGVDLGVYYGIDQSHGTTLTLFSRNPPLLVFSVSMGICEDGAGNTMSFRAIVRNGIPYVPAGAVCSFFGLTYSVLPTANRGTLIRIYDPAAITMDDAFFLSTATGGMTYRYNNIPQSMAAAEATPVPSTAPQSPPPSSGGNKEAVRVYLAVDASQASHDLTALFPANVRALFLFTPDSLSAQSALVRRAVAAGHSVGLIVEGSQEEALAQLEQGNELLSHIARTRTRIVSAPEGLVSGLSAGGWACWQANVTGSTPAALLSAVEARRTVARVTLPTDGGSISRILARLREDGYTLRQPLETDL